MLKRCFVVLEKGLIPNIRMLCFVIINSVVFLFVCFFVLFLTFLVFGSSKSFGLFVDFCLALS